MRPGSLVRALGALAAILLACSCAAERGPAGSQDGLEQEVVVSGLRTPTAFALLPDGRILVAEQSGVVRVVKDGALLEQPFLDIADRVNDHKERGLLGLAVDPDFAANGFVYLLYTYEDDPSRYEGTKTARLTRVTASGDAASPATEVVILGTRAGRSCDLFPPGSDCIPNDWIGHAVGDVAFAPDDTLFVSVGDASTWTRATEASLRAQDLDSPAGKILHVTRTGEGLPSNPFWNGDPEAARSKVWAFGLRNPFRLALSPLSGVPYVGDVGWEDWEEIDAAHAGSNLGWPCYEGEPRQPSYTRLAACRSLYAQGPSAVRAPVLSYAQSEGSDESASVTGGDFYRGGPFPRWIHGAYLYGDFVRGFIRYVQLDRDDRVVSGPWDLVAGADGPVDIQVGPDGAVYYLSIASGELRRISYLAPGSAGPGPELVGRPAVLPTGEHPHSVAIADLDGDGRPDLLAADAGSSDAAVLLGDGAGGFSPAATYGTGPRPKVVIAADLDGDGRPDLASANEEGDSASVLLNAGGGRFGPPSSYPVCSRPHDIAAGDLDGDGDEDLVVACYDGTVVSVLLGPGDGTFGAGLAFESGDAPHSVVVADLDGDGRPDLAVANHGSDDVGVLPGNGDGTFRAPERYPAGRGPHSIRAGDLNGDGRLDLVTANDASDDVSVLLGSGDGTFAASVAYPAGRVPKALAVADLNGDGLADVVTADTGGNYDNPEKSPEGHVVSVLLGAGDGGLGAPVPYLAGPTPFAVAAGDLNGDGLPDLATANWDGGTVSVMLGPRP